MSVYCDWCGELIDSSRRGLVTLEVHGYHDDGGYIADTRRHFHAGDPDDAGSCILQALATVDEHRVKSGAERTRHERTVAAVNRERSEEARREAERAWRQLTPAARESLALQALGDKRLVIRELTERMNAELGYPQAPRPERRAAALDGTHQPKAVYDGEVRNLLRRMLRDGQLHREPETFNKTHTRYRYFRPRGLEGPIADLERAYNDDGEAVA